MFRFDPRATVFVVDGEFRSCNAIASTVRIMGVSMKSFATAEEFLEIKPQPLPCCVVTALQLPGMSGLMLLRQLRTEARSIPLILVSASVDVSLAVEALHFGALGVLKKPYRPQLLWDYIVQALSQDHERLASESWRADVMERDRSLNDEESAIHELMVGSISNGAIGQVRQGTQGL